MSDDTNLSPAAFGRSFRAFLEATVQGQEVEEPPFVSRLAGHLGAEPRGLPILAETFSIIEHPNVQTALDVWISGDGRSAELVGMSAEQKRYEGLGFSDLITPASSGLMGDRAPRPGPVDYVNVPVAHGEVRACMQHGLYLLGDGGTPLAARPGRIDQATEIPLPDADCRRRLISLYARGLDLRLEDEATVVERTEGVSASFIKELLRCAALFSAEEGGDLVVADAHLASALDEMLLAGGTLTVRLLGGEPSPSEAQPEWYDDEPPAG